MNIDVAMIFFIILAVGIVGIVVWALTLRRVVPLSVVHIVQSRKSTKSYGDLLLLETKDWNDDGEYIPNKDKGNFRYDYTILVRFSPDGEAIMKNKNGCRELLFSNWKYASNKRFIFI